LPAEPAPLRAESERVRVGTVEPGDLASYPLAVEQSRTRLSQWNPVDPDDLGRHLAAQSRDHRTFVVHARVPEGAHDLVGKVNVTNVTRGRSLSASMGYDAYDPYAGRGLFAEGLRLVVGLVLVPEPGGMGLHRLEANVQPGNTVSAGLLRSLGFQHQGSFPRMLWLPDASGRERWRDHDSYVMTAEDWPAVPYAPPRPRRTVVLVNGLPTAARSDVARALAVELSLPVLSEDLAARGAAGKALWAMLEASPTGGVVEGWLEPKAAPFVAAGLARAGYALGDVPEVWCDGAAVRPGDHPAGPLCAGPSTRVDTTAPVPPSAVARLALWARAVHPGGVPRRSVSG
jgi:[ribosomal protein S5]-alanine N-acetyltransferase